MGALGSAKDDLRRHPRTCTQRPSTRAAPLTHASAPFGVLLIARKGFSDPCRCTLWNPTVTDVAREATVPNPPSEKKSVPIVLCNEEDKDSSIKTELWDKKTKLLALGLGYGPRSKTYKLLVCHKDISRIHRFRPSLRGKHERSFVGGPTHHIEYSLVVHSFSVSGDATYKETPLRTVFNMGTVLSSKEEVDEEIIQKSLYMDGRIYVLYWKTNVILAFDVDDEKVRTIDMPNQQEGDVRLSWMPARYQLIDMSGCRPCLVITERHSIALRLLTEDYRLEPIYAISYEINIYHSSIVGVWDCGSVLCCCSIVAR